MAAAAATATSADAAASAVVPLNASLERLNHVKHNLTTMGDTLTRNVCSKRDFEENRIFEVRELAQKIEKHLALEVKRRSESDKALQELLESRIAELQDGIERKVSDRLTQMQLNVDILTRKLVSLETELQQERENNQALLERLNHTVAQEVKNIRSTLDHEKVLRMEKEAQLLRKSAEDVYQLQERLNAEKSAREIGVSGVRDALAKLAKDKAKEDEKFKTGVLGDIEQLKNAVRFEHEERKEAEEQMVQTMDQIVKQVHESLEVVSK
eukprot:TRINITY_DN11876_c0_g3_i1.p1 TRINITY_DN11876_c0_g3~~TRINITY_DN11876_c0_g3_i1.p1  ORF type:complete len:296 (+),score=157.62 TRINITY_DN11876_c0_g3_i1:84-890(+)